MKYDSAGKVQESMKVKNFPETSEVELLSYANERQVGKKQVFMKNDGGCIKNEGRGNSFSTHTIVDVHVTTVSSKFKCGPHSVLCERLTYLHLVLNRNQKLLQRINLISCKMKQASW